MRIDTSNTRDILEINGNNCYRYIGQPSQNPIKYAHFEDILMSDVDLSNRNLEGAFLEGSFFAESNFAGADLYSGFFSFMNFSLCNLQNAELRGAGIHYTTFWRADLRGADFSKNNLSGRTCFSRCDLSEIIWDSNTKFTGAEYDNYTVFPDNFCPEDFGMKQKDPMAPFIENKLQELDIFRYKDFQNLTLDQELVEHTSLSMGTFNYCNFKNSLFENITFYTTDFSYCNLANVVFRDCELTRVPMRYADLRGTKFISSNINNPFNLSGVDLTGIIYNSETYFAGAVYDDNTHFSNDFDPESHGMLKIDTICDADVLWQYVKVR